jgi:hypothetical protein
MSSRKVLADNTILYLKNGVLHRKYGPAVIHNDGVSEFWFEGRRHRLQGSAIIDYHSPEIKIRNGKVDPSYFEDENEQDMRNIMYNTKLIDVIVPILTRTFNIIQNTPLKDLGINHREQIDSTEKDTLKIYYNCMAHSALGPAEIKNNGTQVYYMYGVKHCAYGPAIVDVLKKTKYWYMYGILHREDGPAFIRPAYNRINNTVHEWYRYGVRHRLDGPSFIEYNKYNEIIYYIWYKDGKTHRSYLEGQGDGPAIHMEKAYYANEYYEGYEFSSWYLNGKNERWNGPALDAFGEKKWFLNGIEMEKEKFDRVINTVKKIARKFMRPLRRNLSNEIYKLSAGNSAYRMAVSRDISKLIAGYVI